MSLKFEGLYLMQTRECYDANNEVYKIGQSKNIYNGIQQYPNGSYVFFVIESLESKKHKDKVINLLKSNFTQKLNYGKDFFEGDKDILISLIVSYVSLFNTRYNILSEPILITKYTRDDEYILPMDRDINKAKCKINNNKDEILYLLKLNNFIKETNLKKRYYLESVYKDFIFNNEPIDGLEDIYNKIIEKNNTIIENFDNIENNLITILQDVKNNSELMYNNT